MLTPKLEQLIWEAKAEYKTWNIGTNSAQLFVPADKTIIITEVFYEAFIDSGEPNFDVPENWHNRANKLLIFQSQNRRKTLLARSVFWPGIGIINNFNKYDVYFPFNETLNFFIASFNPPNSWVITPNVAPVGSDAKRPPLGYGQAGDGGLPAITRISMAAVSEVRPQKNTPAAIQTSFEDFQVGISGSTIGVNPSTDASGVGNYQFPMITVGYVEINENLKQNFL